ncbi:MAG: DUF3455 domain-containing protein [Acidobacteriota bacterium]|nr:DUF3455 domain-containing protein [Acidobacteriota bacterium]
MQDFGPRRICTERRATAPGRTGKALVLGLAAGLAGFANGWAVPLERPAVPDRSLDPPAAVVPVLKAAGEGVQRYACIEKEGTPGTFAWTLRGPWAKLYDAAHREIGSHSAGPTWQLGDGSKVVKKEVLATVQSTDQRAIPWLLVQVEPSGAGALASVTYVQRIDTAFGRAPATGCDAEHAGATEEVDYSATYLFYAPPPAS